jgi:hypothetical protein
MRDLAVDVAAADAAKKVEAATGEAERFLSARRQWLDATPYDWRDVDKRAEAILRLGFPIRTRVASGRRLGLPDVPTIVEIRLPPELTTPLPEDLREAAFEALAARKPRRDRKGAFAPRNVAIVGAIKRVMAVMGAGFPVTRNSDSKIKADDREIKIASTACQIVREALRRVGVTMGERAIERIWEDRDRTPRNASTRGMT